MTPPTSTGLNILTSTLNNVHNTLHKAQYTMMHTVLLWMVSVAAMYTCGGYLIALDGGHWLNDQSQWYFDATQQVVGTRHSVHGRPHVSRITTSYINPMLLLNVIVLMVHHKLTNYGWYKLCMGILKYRATVFASTPNSTIQNTYYV